MRCGANQHLFNQPNNWNATLQYFFNNFEQLKFCFSLLLLLPLLNYIDLLLLFIHYVSVVFLLLQNRTDQNRGGKEMFSLPLSSAPSACCCLLMVVYCCCCCLCFDHGTKGTKCRLCGAREHFLSQWLVVVVPQFLACCGAGLLARSTIPPSLDNFWTIGRQPTLEPPDLRDYLPLLFLFLPEIWIWLWIKLRWI